MDLNWLVTILNSSSKLMDSDMWSVTISPSNYNGMAKQQECVHLGLARQALALYDIIHWLAWQALTLLASSECTTGDLQMAMPPVEVLVEKW